MKIKTSDLTGTALDWAVAKAAGYTGDALKERSDGVWYTPSTNWAQGGPIVGRERMEFEFDYQDKVGPYKAISVDDDNCYFASGPTHLIAAMRCYVASKLGDEVEVPDELA